MQIVYTLYLNSTFQYLIFVAMCFLSNFLKTEHRLKNEGENADSLQIRSKSLLNLLRL